MAERTCPGCGAPVQAARVSDTDEIVALEQYTDASTEARRFRVVASPNVTDELVVVEVPASAPGDFFPDHHFDCPAGNDGRTF